MIPSIVSRPWHTAREVYIKTKHPIKRKTRWPSSLHDTWCPHDKSYKPLR